MLSDQCKNLTPDEKIAVSDLKGQIHEINKTLNRLSELGISCDFEVLQNQQISKPVAAVLLSAHLTRDVREVDVRI